MDASDAERLTRQILQRGPALVMYARQWLDGVAAEDAVQDALAALLGERSPPANPAAWMYRAVRNRAIDEMRRRERQVRHERTRARENVEWFDARIDARLDAKSAEAALRNLRAEDREIVVLRVWGELGFAEIASVTGMGVSSVHDRYRNALRELKNALEQPCQIQIKSN